MSKQLDLQQTVRESPAKMHELTNIVAARCWIPADYVRVLLPLVRGVKNAVFFATMGEASVAFTSLMQKQTASYDI